MRYRKKSPENSRTGALAYEAMLKHKLARGEQIDHHASTGEQTQTFETFAKRWFEEYVTTNNKFAEIRIKEYTLKSSLVPFFGRIPVKDIKTHHIEQFKSKKMKAGLANKTIKNHLTVLNKCLVCAYDWLGITQNHL
jgi:hypothetical protein